MLFPPRTFRKLWLPCLHISSGAVTLFKAYRADLAGLGTKAPGGQGDLGCVTKISCFKEKSIQCWYFFSDRKVWTRASTLYPQLGCVIPENSVALSGESWGQEVALVPTVMLVPERCSWGACLGWGGAWQYGGLLSSCPHFTHTCSWRWSLEWWPHSASWEEKDERDGNSCKFLIWKIKKVWIRINAGIKYLNFLYSLSFLTYSSLKSLHNACQICSQDVPLSPLPPAPAPKSDCKYSSSWWKFSLYFSYRNCLISLFIFMFFLYGRINN